MPQSVGVRSGQQKTMGREKRIVLITADRAVEGESVIRTFFGAPARLPIGLVTLSFKEGLNACQCFFWVIFHGGYSLTVM